MDVFWRSARFKFVNMPRIMHVFHVIQEAGGFEASRVQKRLLHLLSQAGEGYVSQSLLENVPTPERGDVCHPAKKSLVMLYVERHDSKAAVPLRKSCDLRDGRLLKRERKCKNIMALNRFLQKKHGLYGQQDNLTLQELGVPELAPAHSHRPPDQSCTITNTCHFCSTPCSMNRQACDFIYRYWRRSATVVHEDLLSLRDSTDIRQFPTRRRWSAWRFPLSQ